MKKTIPLLIFIAILFPIDGHAQKPAAPKNVILINNVQIFNGKDEKAIIGNVLIVDNLIREISTTPIATNKSGNTNN